MSIIRFFEAIWCIKLKFHSLSGAFLKIFMFGILADANNAPKLNIFDGGMALHVNQLKARGCS